MLLINVESETTAGNDQKPLCFTKLFGNAHPVEIEIGCGRGRFLFESAEMRPKTNFLGIDRVSRWLKKGKLWGGKTLPANLLFYWTDAGVFIKEQVPLASVSAFHIYFPDPWPKRKDRKHRLLTAAFFRVLYDRLCPGGQLKLVSDHEEYYETYCKEAERSTCDWIVSEHMRTPVWLLGPPETAYSIKFRQEGRTFYYLELKRDGNDTRTKDGHEQI